MLHSNHINFKNKVVFYEFGIALWKADRVIITKLFLGRVANKNIEPVNLEMLANEINTNTAEHIEDYDEVCNKIINTVKSGDIIIVFGVGESYKLSEKIINELKEKTMIRVLKALL